MILCDVILPDANGMDLCRFAKAQNPCCQILLMTSLSDPIDKILGLESCADDYITKPFNERELRARVRSAIRRLAAFQSRESPPASIPDEISPHPDRLAVGDLRMSSETYQAWRQQHVLDLTRKEFELLWLFAANPGKVYTRQSLIGLLWSNNPEINEASINGHIRRLREKVDDPFASRPLIDTVRGIGYRLTP